MPDDTFLKLARAKIAADNVKKKKLARRCKISRPYFSLMLHGDKNMTDAVKCKLIEELNLQEHVKKLGL